MKTRALFLAAFALVLGACTSTRAVLLGDSGPYPAVHEHDVRIFLNEDDVDGEFERIALVTARSDASWADEGDLIRALRKRAARLGADALILGEVRDPTTLERVAEVLTDYEAQRRARGVAIRLLDE